MLIPFDNGKVRVTQGFNYGWHNGMDLVGVDSWQLVAIGDGIIRSAVNLDVHYTAPLTYDRTREWGTYVRLDLNDGTIVYYCHMQPNSLTVKPGQYVTKGTPLGIMGNSGYSLGAHCHFEIRNSGNVVTPTTNTATYTKIPNAVGTYSNESEDDEPMTAEEKKEFEKLQSDFYALKKDYDKHTRVKYGYVDKNMPEWAREDITYLNQQGILQGDEKGNLQLSDDALRINAELSRAVKKLSKKESK